MRRTKIFRLIGQKIYSLWAPFFLADDKRYRRYEIGEYTYGAPKILSESKYASLKIGRYCSIAEGVKIHLGGMHPLDRISTYPFDVVFNVIFKNGGEYEDYARTKGDVVIGNDVWIGTEALILSGARIGDGAVIGARSVVTKDVPPYAIVAGNPAQHVRYRFDAGIVKELKNIAWWNWPREELEQAWPLLLSSDITAFIEKYGKVRDDVRSAFRCPGSAGDSPAGN